MLTIGEQLAVYPDFVIRLVCGSNTLCAPTRGKWAVIYGGRSYLLSNDDYDAVVRLTGRVQAEFVTDNGLSAPYSTEDVLNIRAYAARCVAETLREPEGVTKILFVTDDSLASLRRFGVPAKALGLVGRITSGSYKPVVVADCVDTLDLLTAMQYDVVMVRETTPSDYVTLLRLQSAGKIVIYDIDEYLFDIPLSHPRHALFSQLDKELHYELTASADYVSVRSASQREKLHTSGDRTVVLPDMIDTSMLTPVSPLRAFTRFNIVCVADDTEQENVNLLLDTVVPGTIAEIPNAHFTFVGCAPAGVCDSTVVRPEYASRVSWWGLPPVKNYYRMLSALDADVALIPSICNEWNSWRSQVPVLEFLSRGVWVLATQVMANKGMGDGLPQFVPIKEPGDWVKYLKVVYEQFIADRRKSARHVADAIAGVRAQYDATVVAKMWQTELTEIVSRRRRLEAIRVNSESILAQAATGFVESVQNLIAGWFGRTI
jgi:hypothetical protein